MSPLLERNGHVGQALSRRPLGERAEAGASWVSSPVVLPLFAGVEELGEAGAQVLIASVCIPNLLSAYSVA